MSKLINIIKQNNIKRNNKLPDNLKSKVIKLLNKYINTDILDIEYDNSNLPPALFVGEKKFNVKTSLGDIVISIPNLKWRFGPKLAVSAEFNIKDILKTKITFEGKDCIVDDELFKLLATYNTKGINLICDSIITDNYIFIDTYLTKDIVKNLISELEDEYSGGGYIMASPDDTEFKTSEELGEYIAKWTRGEDITRRDMIKNKTGAKAFEEYGGYQFYTDTISQLDHLGPDMIFVEINMFRLGETIAALRHVENIDKGYHLCLFLGMD